MKSWIARLLTAGAVAPTGNRPRMILNETPPNIYAIGDVHGCLAQLRQLETMIATDAAGLEGTKLIVMLGDYVDRGPQSAQVIDHLLAPPLRGFQRVCLCGNHDAEMLEFLERPKRASGWLGIGGDATLASYGLTASGLLRAPAHLNGQVAASIPSEHREFLQSLPSLLLTPAYIFVHAGLRTGVSIEMQADDDLLWRRDDYVSDYSEFGRIVVHGHAPVRDPVVSRWRIGIDTAAFATGRLTAVRLVANKPPFLLGTRTAQGEDRFTR